MRPLRNFHHNPLDPLLSSKLKTKKLQRLAESYLLPAMFEHTDNLRRAFVYGNSQYIGAVTPNTIDSAKFSRAVVEQTDPEYLILGGFNNYSLSLLMNHKPTLTLHPKDLFCKDLLSRYLSGNQKQPSSDGVFHPENRIFYQVDDRYRMITTNDYMTAGLNSLENEQSKVLFGSPSTIVTLEDLIIRLSLKQIEDMYYQVLDEIRTQSKDEILFANTLMEIWVRETTKTKFKSALFTKTMQYQAGVFRNCARLGKSNLILCDRYFAEEIRHFMEVSDQEVETIYRGYLHDQHHPDREAYEKCLRSDKEEVLRKLYLLSQLVDNSALECIESGHNVLRDSVLSKMFPRMSTQTLCSSIRKCSLLYSKAFLDIQTQFIANNLVFELGEKPQRLELEQQLEVMEERVADFPIEYEVNHVQKDVANVMEIQKLWDMMEDMLKQQKRLRDMELLVEFKNRNYSQENIVLFSKVLGEVKIKSGSNFKLPLFHFRNFSGYFKEVMRDIYLQNEYGIKKVQPPQQPLNIEVRDNASKEEVQQLLQHKDLSQGEMMPPGMHVESKSLSGEEALKYWNNEGEFKKTRRR